MKACPAMIKGGQCPLEEPTGSLGVAAGRNQHVDDLPVLVDRPVHVPPDPVDLHVGLVDEPPVARRVAAESGGVGQQRGEPLHPVPCQNLMHAL
jgi:hypothetical protein